MVTVRIASWVARPYLSMILGLILNLGDSSMVEI